MNHPTPDTNHKRKPRLLRSCRYSPWVAVVAVLIAIPAGLAAEPQVYYTRQPEIRIPINSAANRQHKQVQLCVSTDHGRDWQPVLTTQPDSRTFPPYLFPADGTYWFGVRAIGFNDRPIPPTLAQIETQLIIVLDRKPPTVSIRQIPDSRQGIASIEWDVRDDNFDPRRFALEYRVPGSDWQREPHAEPKPAGQQSWRLEPGVRMEVRLRVADKAGNTAEQPLTLGAGQDGRPYDPPPPAAASASGSTPAPGQPGVFYSKSMKISIGYKFDRRPISGIQVFDLWYTTDKRGALDEGPPKG